MDDGDAMFRVARCAMTVGRDGAIMDPVDGVCDRRILSERFLVGRGEGAPVRPAVHQRGGDIRPSQGQRHVVLMV
jgi:hypothetical protein